MYGRRICFKIVTVTLGIRENHFLNFCPFAFLIFVSSIYVFITYVWYKFSGKYKNMRGNLSFCN